MISVVIPLYNKQDYIVSTVKTVLDQTFSNFELLVVDDESKDQSVEKLTSIKDDRLTILRKKNGGVSSARNYGIKHARYDYIAFLDADDYWHENFLEKIVQLIGKYPEAEVFATNFNYVKAGTSELPSNKNVQEGIIKEYFKLAFKHPVIHSSAVTIKKTAFQKTGYFNEKISRGEDLDMWARLAKACKMAYWPVSCAGYRINAANNSASFIPHPEKSFAYYINLKNASSKFEKKYLKDMIFRRTVKYLFRARFTYAFIMMKKHKWSLFR